MAASLLGVFISKVLAELVSGVTIFAPLGDAVHVLPAVHIIGAIVGLGWAYSAPVRPQRTTEHQLTTAPHVNHR